MTSSNNYTSLTGKKILLGITGSIAAYKSAILTRLLIKSGAEVQIVLSPYAKEFITPLTLSTLSKRPVFSDFSEKETGEWHSHVNLGQWADVFLIAPATTNTMAKCAHGIADNLLTTTYLSAKCPVIFAPAMDLDMFRHPVTQANMNLLRQNGHSILDTNSGELASGLEGEGRMKEPEEIIAFLASFFEKKKSLANKKYLVTAGPTYEKIDPVRYIGNFSSGKMGFAIAEEIAQRGGKVFLTSGPVSLKPYHPNIELTSVTTADEMYQVAIDKFKYCNGAIMAAAVADYKVKNTSSTKIKRTSQNLSIDLVPNKDIAAELGKMKTKDQILCGFALETNDEHANAIKKLKKKNLDFIVLNSLKEKGAGFQYDTNKITILDKNNNITNFELKSKAEVAKDIIDYFDK